MKRESELLYLGSIDIGLGKAMSVSDRSRSSYDDDEEGLISPTFYAQLLR